VENIDRYPTYKDGKVTEVVICENYIELCRFYRYVVNIGRWSPYEGGQLDRFNCIIKIRMSLSLQYPFGIG
jgi:hypothetical protein